jgi:hypothetical protein
LAKVSRNAANRRKRIAPGHTTRGAPGLTGEGRRGGSAAASGMESDVKKSEFSCSPFLQQHAMEIGESTWGLRLEIDAGPLALFVEKESVTVVF